MTKRGLKQLSIKRLVSFVSRRSRPEGNQINLIKENVVSNIVIVKKEKNMENIDKIPQELKDRIAFLRKEKKLTQAQLAEKLGISAQAVSKWESGLSCPDIMILVPLSNIFGVSTDYLLSGKLEQKEAEKKDECNELFEVEEKHPDEEEWVDDIIEKEPELESEEYKSDRLVYENTTQIHSLVIDIGISETVIKEGEDFSFETTGYKQGDFTEKVEDGVWTIKDKGFKFLFFGLENIFSNQKVTITIPRGFHFKNVKIKIGAGKLVGQGISTDTSLLDIGAGEIVLADLDSGPSIVKGGMGKVMLEGRVLGKCKFDCGMGEIAASLRLPEEYGYKIDVGMGEVRLGDDRFGGMGGTYKANTKAENFFKINCGMGAVKVIFG